MNPTNIEWVRNPDGSKGFAFNPLTGCEHDCKYCYARPRALMSQKSPNPKIAYKYRNGFYPTFHPKLLTAPAKRKKSTRVFVCSMADLFGDWVPDEWIKRVFEACDAAPQHTYCFLTKNPKRYVRLALDNKLPKNNNHWYGQTIDCKIHYGYYYRILPPKTYNEYISVEPMLGRLYFDTGACPSWIIVGGQTRPTVLPEKDWILNIKEQCEKLDTPLFMKNNLAGLGIELIQQFPEGRHD